LPGSPSGLSPITFGRGVVEARDRRAGRSLVRPCGFGRDVDDDEAEVEQEG